MQDVILEKGTLSCSDSRFGKVQWPFEEYLFLFCVYELDGFYSDVSDFLKKYFSDEKLFEELLSFQKHMIKRPFDRAIGFSCSYNFPLYFNELLDGKKTALTEEMNEINITASPFENWEMYAKIIVWYGRKDSNCTYIRQSLKGKKHEKVNI